MKTLATLAYQGLTIRDYFADGAKNSLLLSWPQENRVNGGFVPDCDHLELSRQAYAIADAMLAERAKS